jgi:ribonucleoside-diphosphate reductase alpha chain
MNTVVKIEPKDIDSIAFQEASLDIWDKKYRLTSKDGEPIDGTMDDTYKRVARALADVEQPEVREHWYERFLWSLRRGAIPAGHLERGCPTAQACNLDDQLHGVGDDPRLHGRHSAEGP